MTDKFETFWYNKNQKEPRRPFNELVYLLIGGKSRWTPATKTNNFGNLPFLFSH